MDSLSSLRNAIRTHHLGDETELVAALTRQGDVSHSTRRAMAEKATRLVEAIRDDSHPGLMEVFLAEYGLSTDEGIALMCLAEALLRVPDETTIDELIEDKIAPSSWGEHLGKSSSSLVNASTWALMLTGKVLDDDQPFGVAGLLHGAVKRLGEPVIRTAVKHAMKEMGNQFVLGETIESAVKRGMAQEKKGFTYSYDMLGEAALTAHDAKTYFNAYQASIDALSKKAVSDSVRHNPGVSIKLSALHPRYEVGQKQRVMLELVERIKALCLSAKAANMGLNIDAEESDRLDLSLDIIEAVLRDDRLSGWDGFGVVVQAYDKRASFVIDWLYGLASELDRNIMVRLVKGAYWDSEIKRAQVEGLAGFPVFIRKSATDVSYISCANKLFGMGGRIYPQFATHNAHSVCAILEMAPKDACYEFQRLHGMGEALHRQVMEKHKTHCRIYAPVGAHKDLLAYLVRRLLENGANSSFVNQIVNAAVPAKDVAADPFETLDRELASDRSYIKLPVDLYAPVRKNSRGWDLHHERDLAEIERARASFQSVAWHATPLTHQPFKGDAPKQIVNPANGQDVVGTVVYATSEDVESAIENASDWTAAASSERVAILNRAADLYEANFGELFAILTREAGKTPKDAIAELREAVDFIRYYATQVEHIGTRSPRGIISCISPWNFPLAIFTGQISAALASGNGVLAKPADPTPIVAFVAVKLLHAAGVPKSVLQLLPGRGTVVGARLASSPRINGMCFTGSTATAQLINKSLAENVEPQAPFIAETGGLNAMMVDSTALPEQAIKDVVDSAFRSAGQRCSALRLLYVQEDIAPTFKTALFGAMDELVVGDPWSYATDVGPIINEGARKEIKDHIEQAKRDGRLLKQLDAPSDGVFVGPAVIEINAMADMKKEIFGPVLHVAYFSANDADKVINEINASGYGLTFGLHTRIDNRVEEVTSKLNVGNMYINRNQIGAIVGSQPFGGEGLSGTGPKAGGPRYVKRFTQEAVQSPMDCVMGDSVAFEKIQSAIDALSKPSREKIKSIEMPGPTGESNRLSLYPRGVILCLGPTIDAAREQAAQVSAVGCRALIVCPGATRSGEVDGFLNRAYLSSFHRIDGVALWSEMGDLVKTRKALAERDGPLVPLFAERDVSEWCVIERHVCIDTTAAGGNASLLAAAQSS